MMVVIGVESGIDQGSFKVGLLRGLFLFVAQLLYMRIVAPAITHVGSRIMISLLTLTGLYSLGVGVGFFPEILSLGRLSTLLYAIYFFSLSSYTMAFVEFRRALRYG